ncbi:glycoside hydrolase family 15 protein [Dactylosporangium aurantiacum]|uniref:Glycoside hydrolase family 15 protein n=1 Tax=Dactylosporangium aurantiacum TaxID=35754 RepID=A0A9Q9IN12_9ACTN|nr:glycoside hydrolase family 15 protein [Dactylosporangium aurantiacum]MDG6110503.1 glycoside hydrolase family 15 protein [Dactylosporangium aurantiacum]UWZ58641.1 glycoside hydrolase family 15 protein [Dactylosporangium aurantiacum]
MAVEDARQEPQVLRQYAFLGDGRRGALIGPRGDVSWLCVPRWESAAIFASLLGGRGRYVVSPSARYVWGGFYQPGSLIWTSRWVTTGGVVHCREALALPADPHCATLLRRVEAVNGDARVTVTLDPRADFGRAPLEDLRRDEYSWTARTGPLFLRWTGADGAQPDADGVLSTELVVAQGECHDLVLELSDRPLTARPPNVQRAWDATERTWRAAAPGLTGTLAGRDARHACAVLHGLSVPDGGTVAAATTSLPERAEAGRNYDYRYAWIRDQSFIGLAAAAAGVDELLDRAVCFVSERVLADGPRLAPAYAAATGGSVPQEQTLGFLSGYPGAPARTGNWVRGQFQLDAFGEVMLLLAAAARAGRLDDDGRRAVRVAADAVGRRWREPDAGMWELSPKAWTHSRLTCVAGLRQAAAQGLGAVDHHQELARRILAETTATSLHPSGRWQRAPGDPRVDAALLFPGIRGALPLRDPRTAATLSAVRAHLAEDGYVYRFEAGDQPLGTAEGAFLLCGFGMALANHRAGDTVAAARWFERNRAACGPPGLFAEEYDVRQRQLRGNLPQAFVHALLLECATTLSGPPP